MDTLLDLYVAITPKELEAEAAAVLLIDSVIVIASSYYFKDIFTYLHRVEKLYGRVPERAS